MLKQPNDKHPTRVEIPGFSVGVNSFAQIVSKNRVQMNSYLQLHFQEYMERI